MGAIVLPRIERRPRHRRMASSRSARLWHAPATGRRALRNDGDHRVAVPHLWNDNRFCSHCALPVDARIPGAAGRPYTGDCYRPNGTWLVSNDRYRCVAGDQVGADHAVSALLVAAGGSHWRMGIQAGERRPASRCAIGRTCYTGAVKPTRAAHQQNRAAAFEFSLSTELRRPKVH